MIPDPSDELLNALIDDELSPAEAGALLAQDGSPAMDEQVKVIGDEPRAARYAGMHTKRTIDFEFPCNQTIKKICQ